MNNKIYKNIDRLIVDGKEEEASILIEEIWKKRDSDLQKKMAKLSLRIEKQEWRLRVKDNGLE